MAEDATIKLDRKTVHHLGCYCKINQITIKEYLTKLIEQDIGDWNKDFLEFKRKEYGRTKS